MSDPTERPSPDEQRAQIERGQWIEGQLPWGPAGPEVPINPPDILPPKVIVVRDQELEQVQNRKRKSKRKSTE